ncbi:MAG: putative protein y4lL [Geminicoccaceae bacterium]|nr:putative protein y4lL [Geminicoccaceae bacterium]
MPSPSNPAHLRGGIGLRFIVPVAFLMLGALALVGGLLWVGSLKQDELGLSHQRQLVEHAVRSRLNDLSITAKDYSWWDDAVRYLVREFDPDWADGNSGIYVLEMFGYDHSFVIDGADRTVYAAIDGERASADAFATLSPDLRNLVEEARRAPQDEPQAAAGLLHGTDGVVLVAASAVLPQEGSQLELLPGPRSVLVLAQRLDELFLQGAEDAYRIRGLRLLPAKAQAPAAALPLIAPDGARLGCLTWLPERPGWELVRWVMPGLSGALLLFVDIAEASSDWIWETDAQLRVEFVSERFAEITGLGRDRVLGRTLAGLFHPAEELERWERHLGDLAAQRPFRDVLCRLDEAPNHDRTLRIAGKPIVDGDGSFRGYRGTATDITAELEAQSEAWRLARHDPVTGLPNRLLVRERLAQAVAECRRTTEMAAVMCLDLDRFKEINDRFGHAAGDLLIKACGERLAGCLRETDTVARLGGDEFAIVQARVERVAEVRRLADRLLACLHQPFELDGHEAMVTASIGVAIIPMDGDDPAALLQNADIALYRAKSEGRNRFRFFEPGMDAELRERKGLEAELRHAVHGGELEVYYQPQIDLRSGALAGVEALVRWNHPVRGLIPAAAFIPIAEETGLLLAIGEWMIPTACREAAAWPRSRLSINLSPLQFKQQDLVGTIRDALASARLAPDRLELEISESVLLHDAQAALLTLMQLKELGVRIAIGDFGTGDSSFRCLQKFRFDKLKIDRSFVQDLDGGSDSEALVRAVVGLGRSLGMETCAEGVERVEQLALLEGEGCDQVQGFLFSQPMPAAALAQFIERAATQPRAIEMMVDRSSRRA